MEYQITKDGDQFCCTFSNFINLQESPAGFGETPDLAKIDLLEQAYAELYPSENYFGNASSCGDCEVNLQRLNSLADKYPKK